jgi:hypothetical protein
MAAWVIYGQRPDLAGFVGMGLIVAGVLSLTCSRKPASTDHSRQFDFLRQEQRSLVISATAPEAPGAHRGDTASFSVAVQPISLRQSVSRDLLNEGAAIRTAEWIRTPKIANQGSATFVTGSDPRRRVVLMRKTG